MKKQIFAIAAIGMIASGMLYSCKKDNTPAPETAGQQVSVKRAGTNYMQQMGTTYNDVLPNYECGDNTGTCIKGVVVEAPKPRIFSGVLTQGNAAATGTFFANVNNQQYIPAVVLNDAKLMQFLSSGEAYSKLLKSSAGKEIYLIGQSADLTVANSLVMPVAIID
jgi:hypothetical protein